MTPVLEEGTVKWNILKALMRIPVNFPLKCLMNLPFSPSLHPPPKSKQLPCLLLSAVKALN